MKKEVTELVEPEVMQGTALMQLEKAAIDMQIATAHQYPRSMTTFKRKSVDMATLDEETAESCIYRRPVGGGKHAEGMSVRTAEIVGACYGNLRVGARIIEQTDRYVVAQGVAHDLESNFMSSCEVKECTVKADGSPYSERMSVVVAKVALAKARRDATFQVVPKALCKPIEAAVRNMLFGGGQTLDKRRERAGARILKFGIDEARVFDVLGVDGLDDVGAKELEVFSGLMTAVKEDETTIDEAFPSIEPKDGTGILEPVGAKKKEKDAPAESAPAAKDQEKVEDMKSPELVAEIKTHEGASYFDGMLAETIPEGKKLESTPMGLLRRMLNEMRVRGNNE